MSKEKDMKNDFTKCIECGKKLNLVEVMVGGGVNGEEPICQDCVDKKHRSIIDNNFNIDDMYKKLRHLRQRKLGLEKELLILNSELSEIENDLEKTKNKLIDTNLKKLKKMIFKIVNANNSETIGFFITPELSLENFNFIVEKIKQNIENYSVDDIKNALTVRNIDFDYIPNDKMLVFDL